MWGICVVGLTDAGTDGGRSGAETVNVCNSIDA